MYNLNTFEILQNLMLFLLQVLRIKPPMCVTRADADFTVQVLQDALEKIK